MSCKDPKKTKIYNKRYWRKNKKKILKQCHTYYGKNKITILGKKRIYYKKNHSVIKSKTRKHYHKTRENNLKRMKLWQKKNKHKVKSYQLEKHYGITLKEYNRIFVNQGGKCAICRKKPDIKKKYFAVDHNHRTGTNRGILCHACNIMIGNAKDSIKLLQAGIRYLNRYE